MNKSIMQKINELNEEMVNENPRMSKAFNDLR